MREVSWRRRETTTYWPQVPLTIVALLPHSAGLLNRGHWGPNSSVWSWFLLCGHPISNCNWNSNLNWLELYFELQLSQAVCGTCYIIVWRPPASCGHKHLHQIQPHPQVKVIFWYLWPDAPVSWLTARLRVNMLEEWIWEQWQWKGALHSPKLQHHWNLTIRLFGVISRTLIGRWGRTPLLRSSQWILQPQPTGQHN